MAGERDIGSIKIGRWSDRTMPTVQIKPLKGYSQARIPSADGLSRILHCDVAAMHAPRKTPTKHTIPALLGHHSPSNALLSTLQPIQLLDLDLGTRHIGTAIYLQVVDVAKESGAVFTVKDATGRQGQVWSLLTRPFGGQEADYTKGTIYAVKEPTYGIAPSGQTMICVHHPTDIVWVSPFDSVAAELFPASAKAGDSVDWLKEGNAAFLSAKFVNAIDAYTRGITALEDVSQLCNPGLIDESTKLVDLTLKRAFAYSREGSHGAALRDALKVLDSGFKGIHAVRLACHSAIEGGRLEEASKLLGLVERLDIVATQYDNAPTQKLMVQLQMRQKQAIGEVDLGTIAQSISRTKCITDAATYIGNIEIRPSPLGGRGMFSKHELFGGELLLCEKPLAVAFSAGDYANDVLQDIVLGETTNGRKLALLQQLATKCNAQPELQRELIDLYAGEKYSTQCTPTSEEAVFNIYRTLSSVQFNALVIFPGKTSDSHDHNDPSHKQPASEEMKPDSQAPGIWPKVSKCNHSCVPNASWSWIGDLIVLRAMHEIEADEEITLSYIPTSYDYDKRQKLLKRQNGFDCACQKCQADGLLNQTSKQQRVCGPLSKHLTFFVQNFDHDKVVAIKDFEDNLTRALKTYDPDVYRCLPYLEMAPLSFQLAHLYLGEIRQWENAPGDVHAKARDCFKACLELGLHIKLVELASPHHCDLLMTKHSQAKAVGVLALMGLAELAYFSAEAAAMERSAAFQTCAKKLYLIAYGEDATFDEHHTGYKCKAVGKGSHHLDVYTSQMEDARELAKSRDRLIPNFLT